MHNHRHRETIGARNVESGTLFLLPPSEIILLCQSRWGSPKLFLSMHSRQCEGSSCIFIRDTFDMGGACLASWREEAEWRWNRWVAICLCKWSKMGNQVKIGTKPRNCIYNKELKEKTFGHEKLPPNQEDSYGAIYNEYRKDSPSMIQLACKHPNSHTNTQSTHSHT